MPLPSLIQFYYNTILNRTGSADEIAGWTDLVQSGAVTVDQVQTALINSFETLSNVQPIVEMYQADLGRVPDQRGLHFWVSQLDSGAMTLQQIGLAIAGSAESQAYYGAAYDAGFVLKLYERILGREPEPGAVTSWLALKAGGMTQAMMKEAFRDSPEAKARAASAVTNFLESIAQGNPDAYTGSLFAAGSIFTLTTGQDSGIAFTGTSGNDTFNATEDTSGLSPIPTWTTSDAIDGGAGTNTFNVTQTASIDGAPLNASVTNIQIANIISGGTVTLDTTGWDGLLSLNVTDLGTTDLAAAGTTAVEVTDTAGRVTITGGSDQTVSTSAGNVTVSGATGSIAVTDSDFGAHSLTIDGGTSVDVTVSGETTGATITIGSTTAPTGVVTVDATSSPDAASAMGTITVVGGSMVDVTENVLGPVNASSTAGSVVVTGTAATTAVSVTQTARAAATPSSAGVVNNSVAIIDVNAGSNTLAGTITSITANNYTALGIADNGLTTLSLAGGSGNVIIDNSGLDTPTNTTLNLTVNGLTGGTLDDADIYTTLHVTTTGTNSTVANITYGALTTLTVAGTKVLRLTSTAGLSALNTVTVSGSAGVTADFSSATVTAIDTSATTGTSTVTMDASKATFTGGAGVDKVTTTNSVISKAISLGDGNDSLTIGSSSIPTVAISGGPGTDTLGMSASLAATASSNGTFASLVTGFENLVLTGATNQTIDLAVLGIPDAVSTSGGNGLTLANLNSGGTLTLTGAGTAYTIANSAFVSGVNDTINLALSDGSGAGVAFASTGITASGVETIAITTADTRATPSGTFNDLVTLLGNSSKTITVGGNAGLTLTATSTGLTTVDASGITLGGFTWTSGALASAATVTGSINGTNTVNFSAATGVVTYIGGSGNDNVTATNGRNNVISLAGGNNSLVGTSGNNTVTGEDGNNTVTLTSGNNAITLGNGTNNVTVTNGNNTISVGTGANTLTVGSGANTITLGAHSGGTADSIAVGATGTGTFVPTATITGLNAAGLDTITFAGDAGANSFTAFTGSQMISFGDALGNNVTAGSPPPTLASAVADVLGSTGGNLAQHAIGAFQYGGNTYLVEQAGATGSAFAAGDTLVELMGTPTFNTTSVSSGVLHLLT